MRTRTIHGQSAISRTEHMTQVIEKYGAPGGTRTPDLLVRSQTLYPTELRAHPWQLYYFTSVTRQLQLPARQKFWSTLEQHKLVLRIQRRLFPLRGVAVRVLHPCANRVRTLFSACAP